MHAITGAHTTPLPLSRTPLLSQGEEPDTCWPLLMDLCGLLAPGPTPTQAVPLLLRASGNGPQLAALVRTTLQQWRWDGGMGSEGSREAAATGGGGVGVGVGVAWAALQCLPHAAEHHSQTFTCCEALLTSTSAALPHVAAEAQQALLMLHCKALAAHSLQCSQHRPGSLHSVGEIPSLKSPAVRVYRVQPCCSGLMPT
jgi:hypothetical protein